MRLSITFISLSCVGALLVWGMGASLKVIRASAQEQTVKCEDIPAAVRTSFQTAYPKANIDGCAKEDEKGKTAYEITSSEGKTKRDALFYEDGTVIVVEEAIDAADLPQAVRQAMSEALADHNIERTEKLMRDNTVKYEIKSKHRGVALEIVFDGNGKVVKVEVAEP